MQIYSPNNIEVLLHYHVSLDPHPHIHAPAVMDAIALFLDNGCMQNNPIAPFNYELTPKGKAWVRALCQVEMPRIAYVDQYGDIL